MDQVTNKYTSIQQVADTYLNAKKPSQDVSKGGSFASFLEDQLKKAEDGVHFSKHAAKRLDDRSIEITEDMKSRLNEGVEKASEKGIKDSLVMVDSLAFIVNVPSHTVITALDNGASEDGIFTNIDGAVIA